jgi:sulfur relay (sulfurtransferase) DsrC/TusE family protein
MNRQDFEEMEDGELQESEDWINEIQEIRARVAIDPIDAERGRVLKGLANFFKRFGNSETLSDLWK